MSRLGQRFLPAFVAVLALAMMPAGAVAGSHGGRVSPELQSALDDSVDPGGVPGVIAWVKDGAGRPSTGAAGVADLRAGRPIHPLDRFRIGSVTKSFVATVVLQLVAERRVSLEETVGRWLPGVLPYAGQITVRQVLNHTSGVPDYVSFTERELYHGNRFRHWSPRELIGLIAGQEQLFAAGTAWSYSNTNYTLAGLIVERATRRSISEEIERRIIRPLRLHNTTFPIDFPFLLGRHARGYSIQYDEQMNPLEDLPLIDITAYNPSQAWANGNMVSDADDLTRFFRALLRGGLLPPGLLAQMKTPVLDSGYGLGLVITDSPCGPLYGHDGVVPGFIVVVNSSEDGNHQYLQMTNAGGIPSSSYEPLLRGLDLGIREAFDGEPCTTG
jgi:D-alanyl-D-alanine carboxypeptidase